MVVLNLSKQLFDTVRNPDGGAISIAAGNSNLVETQQTIWNATTWWREVYTDLTGNNTFEDSPGRTRDCIYGRVNR